MNENNVGNVNKSQNISDILANSIFFTHNYNNNNRVINNSFDGSKGNRGASKKRLNRRSLNNVINSSVKNNNHLVLHFNDPYFDKQWHLLNRVNPGRDMNVVKVWSHNITGRGITIAVIDDAGLDWNSTDIRNNYEPLGSYDVVSNDNDPTPSKSKDTNHHGTRCAGEIAATANNSFCGVGLAFNAKISGIRLIDGPMTDEAEARAFIGKLDVNDVYSCSWGPEDDGKTLDGPHKLAFEAMRLGTDYGRGGYGSIYVVASGNGGRNGDNCNYDGYANSVFTITIGAVDEEGEMPDYSEQCASMLAVAYSSGSGKNIVTSDWSVYGSSGCTESHSGTSAAAPLAAGWP
ncbi:hypothetical protein HELRODRAFT_81814 [Helobdella robusta]|uniref:Peptidase S8/S53 domain-containing protein n=1 Tax=Helobdella robusta TaxID=6412 RepID=T1G4I9_HELRO|nr:hypothetical protein HELRODRAFT_81814 [Helobdella robusta]ESO01206.1 hypothetical protein HELRODRAFT_81814 [Helobdella robusta]